LTISSAFSAQFAPLPVMFRPSLFLYHSTSISLFLRSQSAKERNVYWRITLRGLSGRSSVLKETRPWCHLCVSPFLPLTRKPSTLPAGTVHRC